MFYDIPEDPIISCIERTGYPPWMQDRPNEEGWDDEDDWDDDESWGD